MIHLSVFFPLATKNQTSGLDAYSKANSEVAPSQPPSPPQCSGLGVQSLKVEKGATESDKILQIQAHTPSLNSLKLCQVTTSCLNETFLGTSRVTKRQAMCSTPLAQNIPFSMFSMMPMAVTTWKPPYQSASCAVSLVSRNNTCLTLAVSSSFTTNSRRDALQFLHGFLKLLQLQQPSRSRKHPVVSHNLYSPASTNHANHLAILFNIYIYLLQN